MPLMKKLSRRQAIRQRKMQKRPEMSTDDLLRALGMSPKQRSLNQQIEDLTHQVVLSYLKDLEELRLQTPS